jgi:hypothetical protein
MFKNLPTFRELANKYSTRGHFGIDEYFHSFCHSLLRSNPALNQLQDCLTNAAVDYIFEKDGKKTWLLTKESVDILNDIEVDSDDISSLAIPYDSFQVCFEDSVKFDGLKVKLNRMKIATINDRMCRTCEYGVSDPNFKMLLGNKQLLVCSDFGEKEQPYGDTVTWDFSRNLDSPYTGRDVLTEDEHKAAGFAMEFAIKIIMLWNARPEIVRDYKYMQRTCFALNKHMQSMKHYNIIKMPDSLIVYNKNKNSQPTGRTVSPHFRGYVLRHLRNERYKRNDDGTIKTVLVEPCLVGGSTE